MIDQPIHFFYIIFPCVFALIVFLIGLWAGYSAGKHKGMMEEIRDRISRDIIEDIRNHNSINKRYYSKEDIEQAKKYGKKIGFLFLTGDDKKLRMINGGKQ